MEAQHEVHIKFIRKYGDIIRDPAVLQEIKAIAAIFFSKETLHCHWCESGAMVDDSTSWDVDADEDNVLFDMSVCRIFGSPDDSSERCLNMLDMEDLARDTSEREADDEDPVKLRDLLLRVHRLATKAVISTMAAPPFSPSPVVLSMARELDDHVRTVRMLRRQSQSVVKRLSQTQESPSCPHSESGEGRRHGGGILGKRALSIERE